MEHYIFSLGVGLHYEYCPPGIRDSAPYIEMGKKLWDAFKNEFYEVICNKVELRPREWMNDLISGDIRNLITGVVAAITAKYDVTIGIALPAAALLVKTGIFNYCSQRPDNALESTVQQILDDKKSEFSIFQTSNKPEKNEKKKKSKTKKK